MIGYYVHHHGRGHLHRAESIARTLSQPVTVLSSLADPRAEWYAEWVTLPRDDDRTGPDATANGALHWAPRHSPGLRDRMATIAAWVRRAEPDTVVVDVSVEVTVYLRLMGIPVVVVAQPGDRFDAPHQLAYAVADQIVAVWPQAVYDPAWLAEHQDKTHYVGAWSRFDGRPPETRPHEDDRLRVLVLAGAGGTDIDSATIARLAQDHPQYAWDAAGLPDGQWQPDPWPTICSADVVITHAGANSLAEVATARRPAIVVAQDRPHGEQHALARALGQAGITTAASTWPATAQWPGLIAETLARGAGGWSRWTVPQARQRAARVIESVAGVAGVSGASGVSERVPEADLCR